MKLQSLLINEMRSVALSTDNIYYIVEKTGKERLNCQILNILEKKNKIKQISKFNFSLICFV